jgi:glycosyltransferase involved in cell wall biosynthesis
MIFETGIKDQELCAIYNAFDVQLYPSFREGWGLTITEASSCGVPTIGHRFSSMIEQIEGRGWLCESAIRDHTTPINADTAIPDPVSVAKCLEEAYMKPDLLKRYGKECRKYALTMDWDDLVRDKWLPKFDSIVDELKAKPVTDRRIM